MAKKGGQNDATRFRSVKRRSGRGDNPQSLMRDAESIRDPYFRSLSMLVILFSGKISDSQDNRILERVIRDSKDVKQEWRRAELMTEILKISSRSDGPYGKRIESMIMNEIMNMKPGSGKSDAIKGATKFVTSERIPDLIGFSLENRGFEKDDIRTIIRSTSENGSLIRSYGILFGEIGRIEDQKLKFNMYGYLHLQSRKAYGKKAKDSSLKEALNVLFNDLTEERVENFGYLCRNCIFADDIKTLEEASDGFINILDRIKAECNLATACDRVKDLKRARKHLEEAERIASDLESEIPRSKVLSLIGSGRSRIGDVEIARSLFERALKDSAEDQYTRKRIQSQMERSKIIEKDHAGKEKVNHEETVTGTRNLLAIYDTYEGGLKPVHSRMVARAAPLCYAFDLDLALMGFPTTDLDRIIELSVNDTNIGKGGQFIMKLKDENRISLIECSTNDPPWDWSDIGMPVATTSDPKKGRSIDIKSAVKRAKKNHPTSRVCLIMGLGKRGLPASLIESVPHHLEITGVNVPLETATAMGILAYILGKGGREEK